MTLQTESPERAATAAVEVHLPCGLVGLPKLVRFTLEPMVGNQPFFSLKALEGGKFNFVVVEPQGLIPDYVLELSDGDADFLEIHSAEEARILNIVTVHSFRPQYVTVNLVGPIVVNRRTLSGKQVILANAERYSTHHVLIDARKSSANGNGGAEC